MRVIVTGGSGRLGQAVVRELFTHGHQLAVLDLTKPRECVCPTYPIDLSKTQPLEQNFKSIDGVVHLARQRFPYTETGFNPEMKRWEFADPLGDAERFNLNVAITSNVLAVAQAAGVKKIALRVKPCGLRFLLSAHWSAGGLLARRRSSSAEAARPVRVDQACRGKTL
jgi:nucleoside-diphosphate-sugar epimerase